jgi:hypothetical protein
MMFIKDSDKTPEIAVRVNNPDRSLLAIQS